MDLPTGLYVVLWASISLIASAHAILNRRDSRALVGWVGVIWLAPFFGSLLYWMFGINRIRRRAQALQNRDYVSDTKVISGRSKGEADCFTTADTAHLKLLGNLVHRVVQRPLLAGNHVQLLLNGDEAYPEMIRTIDAAEHSVALCTYILDNDHAGQLFIRAMQKAVERGVLVRLLIDDVGARYSWPSAVRMAKRAGITVARFLPVFVPRWLSYSNLRNHRKILVVDGRIGFTGGMNIREEHCLERGTRHPIRDVHFRITGPVVSQLQDVFARDWFCTTGERLVGKEWFPAMDPSGTTYARGISDGPDDDLDKLRVVLMGAIASAHRSISIVTPYFLPDAALIATLNIASMRGIRVRIVIPEKTNLALVQWASTAQLWQLLRRGCRVWQSPTPFDHSKLMIVDDYWSLLGSMNWDPRSLRLNFEFNIECFDAPLASSLAGIVDGIIERSREITLGDVDGRSLAVKLRDGTARILSPYL